MLILTPNLNKGPPMQPIDEKPIKQGVVLINNIIRCCCKQLNLIPYHIITKYLGISKQCVVYLQINLIHLQSLTTVKNV